METWTRRGAVALLALAVGGCGTPGRRSWIASEGAPPGEAPPAASPAADDPAPAWARRFQVALRGRAAEAAWLPSGDLLTLTYGGGLRRWRPGLPPVEVPMEEFRGGEAMALPGDGSWVAVREGTGEVRIREPATGAVRVTIPAHVILHDRPPYHLPRPLAAAPDGTWLAVASDDDQVRLHDVHTGEVRRRVGAQGRRIQDLAVSPAGRWLAASDDHGWVRVWDLEQSGEPWQFNAHQTLVAALTFLDEDTLLTGGFDARILALDVPAREVLRALTSPVGQVQVLTRGPGGLWVGGARNVPHRLTGSPLEPGDLDQAWRPLAGGEVQTFALAVSPQGRVAHGGGKAIVRVWEPR